MDRKYFFFDIDNTIAVWPDSSIPDSTMETLYELRRRGHHVALNTGRIQVDAKRFADLAQVQDFSADGGHSLTIEGSLLYMEGMDRGACISYLEQLESHGIPWAVTDRNQLSRITPYKRILDWHPDWDVFKTVVDPDFDFHQVENFFKIYAFFLEGEEEEKQIQHFTKKLIRYGEGCILFEPMDKARGVRAFMDFYKEQDYAKAVVFGDGMNDLSMFKPDWFKIAMGNGRDELKERADYVTDDCDKDGIWKACRKFGWI